MSVVTKAAAPELTLKSSDGKVWTFVIKDNYKVSESCLKTSCLALNTINQKENKQTQSGKYLNHPAAGLCEIHHGKYIVGTYKNGDEDGICVFKDQSFILGWDFYKRHQPKKEH